MKYFYKMLDNGLSSFVNYPLSWSYSIGATILQNHYNKMEDMIKELDKFLVYYNTQRRHSGLVKELGVKTPLQALEKWYEINPNIFLVSPIDFLNNCLNFAKKV